MKRGSLTLWWESVTERQNLGAGGSKGGGGGLKGVNLPQRFILFFACQYMKIPADLDPNPIRRWTLTLGQLHYTV